MRILQGQQSNNLIVVHRNSKPFTYILHTQLKSGSRGSAMHYVILLLIGFTLFYNDSHRRNATKYYCQRFPPVLFRTQYNIFIKTDYLQHYIQNTLPYYLCPDQLCSCSCLRRERASSCSPFLHFFYHLYVSTNFKNPIIIFII